MQSMAIKRSWFVMPYKLKKIKWKGGKNDMRYPDAFAKKFILDFTQKGDMVFDPFAGFGTTLIVAQKLGRIGIGIEYEKARLRAMASNRFKQTLPRKTRSAESIKKKKSLKLRKTA